MESDEIRHIIAALAGLKLIPYAPVGDEEWLAVYDWGIKHCRGTDKVSAEQHARDLASRGSKTERWGGIAMLEEINNGLLAEYRGAWQPSYVHNYEPPRCVRCSDHGFWQDPERKVDPYVHCGCGALPPEIVDDLIRAENDRFRAKRNIYATVERARSIRRTKQQLEEEVRKLEEDLPKGNVA